MKSFAKKYLLVASFVLLSLVGGRVAHADNTACSTDTGLSQVSSLFSAQYCSAPTTLSLIINVLLGFLGIISVLFIIIGGYRMVISNGSEDGFKKGRQTVLYAVIGLLVAIFAFAIISIVGQAVINPTSTTTTTTSTTAAPAAVTPSTTANS